MRHSTLFFTYKIMSFEGVKNSIPSLSTVVVAISVLVNSTQAKAADAIIVEPSGESISWLCLWYEKSSLQKTTNIPQEEPQEQYIAWRIPSDIRAPISDTFSELSWEFGLSIKDIDFSDTDTIFKWLGILNEFFYSMYSARDSYIDPKVYPVEYYEDNYDISKEEAQSYHEKDKKYLAQEQWERTEAQKIFLDNFALEKVEGYYDILRAIQLSDDIETKRNIAFIFDFARGLAVSQTLNTYEGSKILISKTQQSYDEYREYRRHAREEEKNFKNGILEQIIGTLWLSEKYDASEILSYNSGRVLAPISLNESVPIDQDTVEQKQHKHFLQKLIYFVLDTDTQVTIKEFIERVDCKPESIDVSPLTDDVIASYRQGLQSMRSTHQKKKISLKEKLGNIHGWASVFSSQLSLLRYGVNQWLVLDNLEDLLVEMARDDASLRTAYTSYEDYTRIREQMWDFVENPRLDGLDSRYQKIFKEVKRRQNQQLRMYKKRKKQLQ